MTRSAFAAHVRDGNAGIYAIVDAASAGDPLAAVRALLNGGVRLIQYRAKRGVERDIVRRLHRETAARDALLIVNDDPVAALDADGLHVGPEDIAALGPDLRRRVGERVLGVSCGAPQEVAGFAMLEADYFGVGPYAATTTKMDAGEPIGARGVAAVVAAASGTPVAAIGGIGLDDLDAILRTGARMAAIASALTAGPDTEAAARAFVERWRELWRLAATRRD